MNTSLTDECDVVAHRSWTKHRTAYLRGVPTWVWQAAMCRRQSPRRQLPPGRDSMTCP